MNGEGNVTDAARKRADVLVVDDTAANIRLLSKILDRDGHQVRSATDGQLGLAAAREQKPDLVLLDIKMPGMDGFEVCETLKADPALRDVPVMFISALSDTLDKVRAFRSGGVDYVTKPFDPAEVCARVRTHLRLERLGRRVRRQNAHLREANRELQRRTEYEENLTRLIVHDLRAPLSGVMGYLELLQINTVGELNDEFREDIDKALAVSLQMSEVIDSLLDLSRMDCGEELLCRRVRTNLTDLAQEATTSLESVLEYRQLETQVPESEACVTCDPMMIRRVIVNLLHNALKFTTRTGRIILQVETIEGRHVVSVTDDGPGIPEELKSHIFDRYGLSGVNENSRVPLPGLGLAFCKMCVDAHGGEIGVENPADGGTRFWFSLEASP